MWPKAIDGVDPILQDLIDLCLCNLDAYSAVLFVADRPGAPLKMRAFQSLSRRLDTAASFRPGELLLGWVYKEKKPLNLNRFNRDAERLLFYNEDENIKSFMAIPLEGLPAVLAVDSKQRYIFSDKSAKLLFQFGQTITKVWRRLGASSGARPENGALAPESEREILFWKQVEEALGNRDQDGGGLNPVLAAAKDFSGLGWAFLTALLPGDQKHYHIIAASSEMPQGLELSLPINSGLAGWLHTKLKPLALDRIRADGQLSYVFHKNEPLKNLGAFYGWPLTCNQSPRGALILAGSGAERMNPAAAEAMSCLAMRLAAQLQQDRLIERILELSRLDPQTGLPHRSYFVERLSRMMELGRLSPEGGVRLFVLAVSGLGEFAARHGQEATRELLRSVSQALLSGARFSWELGHVSYGVFTLAVPGAETAEAKTHLGNFKKRLEDLPLPDRSGRASLGLLASTAAAPEDGERPEELLESALMALAELSDEDEGAGKSA